MISTSILPTSPYTTEGTGKQLRFGAGQITLFSDFDGTYLPASHKTIALAPNKQALAGLDRYFAQFRQWLQSTQNGFHFQLTTGRNLGEFQSLLNHFRRLDLKMPLPDSVIIKNGADEYYRRGHETSFYQNGAKPFSEVNQAKRDTIRTKTGWDGPRIRSRLKTVLAQEDFQIREDLTTSSATDYGQDSALDHVHDHYDRNESPSPWTAILRQDGDLKFFIGLPKELDQNPARKQALNRLQTRIKTELNELTADGSRPLQYTFHYRPKDSEYGKHPSLSIAPELEGNELTKVYDTTLAVKQAALNHDLIIVAGNGDNDFEMLNPARYLSLSEELQQKNSTEHWVDDPKQCLKLLALHPELQAQWDALPFVGIVITHPESHKKGTLPNRLHQLINAYSTGPNPKIIRIPEGHLLDGIRKVIQNHQSKNALFAAGMSPNLKQALANATNPSTLQNNTPPPTETMSKADLSATTPASALNNHTSQPKTSMLSSIKTFSQRVLNAIATFWHWLLSGFRACMPARLKSLKGH